MKEITGYTCDCREVEYIGNTKLYPLSQTTGDDKKVLEKISKRLPSWKTSLSSFSKKW